MSSAYSDLKAAWHSDRIEQIRETGLICPTHVQLILSDLCNQDCHFCSYRMSNGFSSEQFVIHGEDGSINHNPNRMIPFEKAQEILLDLSKAGVRAVQFTGGGEPTVHPHHLELFRMCLDLGMEAALVTNGIILRKGWETVLPKMSWIRVSVDAGSPEVYGRVRNVPAAMFEKALSNMKEVGHAIKGTPCLFGAGYVVTAENWRDIQRGVALLRDTGVAYVRMSAMFSREFDHYYEGIDAEIRKEIQRAKDLETDSFKVVDLYSDRISDMEQHAPDYDFCGYQQFNVYIGGNLKVYRCCNTAYTLHGEVGDLSKQTFADWLKSQQRRDSYLNFNARSCEVCQFNNKNRVINYMVGQPTHVNFV